MDLRVGGIVGRVELEKIILFWICNTNAIGKSKVCLMERNFDIFQE